MEANYFTMFTSVYNRKHTIDRVWDSLMNQTNKNFEWILIDNGSSDGIEPLLEEYKAKADFPVTLIFQKNRGKQYAMNQAIDLAKGELFMPVDSDDTFEYDLIERLTEVWKKYKADNISGIEVLCKDEEGNIVGDKFPVDEEGVSNFENVFYKHNVRGEKWGAVRVDLLRKYRLPVHDFDVKYIPDHYVWAQIGFNYDCVYLNEPFRTYFQDSGNQITHEKNLTYEVMRMKNWLALWEINYMFPRTEKYISLNKYLQKFVFLWLTTFRTKKSVVGTLKSLKRWKSKLVALLLLIPSFFIKVFNLNLDSLKS